MTDIADAFEDTEPEPEKAEPEEKGESEESEAEEVEEKPDDGEPPSPDEDKSVPQAALLAERRRRQKAEEEAAKLRDEQEKAKAPDPEEDPEGYAKWAEERYANVSWNTKVHFSRKAAMKVHDDYETLEQRFLGLVMEDGKVTNQALIDQMKANDDPADFVYSYMKEYEEIQTWSDPKKREEYIQEQVKKALESQAPPKPDSVKATELPNLTQATAAASNTEPVEKVSTLSDVTKDAPLDKVEW